MEDSNKLAVQLWAIGDEVRLRILACLPYSEECVHRNNVTELSARLEIPQPTVSHHLRVLRQAGIVKRSKMCRDCFYWIDVKEGESVIARLRSIVAPREDSVVSEDRSN